jgi:hypothetical protein
MLAVDAPAELTECVIGSCPGISFCAECDVGGWSTTLFCGNAIVEAENASTREPIAQIF